MKNTLKIKDVKSDLNPVWCPGCGDFAVLSALYRACVQMQLPLQDTVIAAGIGCSSRLPFFTKYYGFHGVHGRVLPLASGMKLNNPNLNIIAVGGDGDGLAIGGGHFMHAARRNVNITYIMMDNSVYGLTKGQASPTTSKDFSLKTSQYLPVEENIDPVLLALSSGSSFVARAFSSFLHPMVDMFVQAIKHKGFSFVQVISPCSMFNNNYQYYKDRVQNLDDDHPVGDRGVAMQRAVDDSKVCLGLFYRQEREVFFQSIRENNVQHDNNKDISIVDKEFLSKINSLMDAFV